MEFDQDSINLDHNPIEEFGHAVSMHSLEVVPTPVLSVGYAAIPDAVLIVAIDAINVHVAPVESHSG